MDFRFSFTSPKEFSLSGFFQNLNNKIDLYEEHVKKTVGFYENDLKPKLDELAKQYKADSEEAKKYYNITYGKWDGEDHARHLIA